MSSKKRAIAKSVTWRITASITTMIIVYFMTGSLILVASIGALEILLKMLVYYAHERSWDKIKWGK